MVLLTPNLCSHLNIRISAGVVGEGVGTAIPLTISGLSHFTHCRGHSSLVPY
jgi:hypothetical protein